MSKLFREKMLSAEPASGTAFKSKFGAAILAKYGWKEGEGLGKKQDGIVDPVKLNSVKDNKGLGKKDYDPWHNWWDDMYNQTAKKSSKVTAVTSRKGAKNESQKQLKDGVKQKRRAKANVMKVTMRPENIMEFHSESDSESDSKSDSDSDSDASDTTTSDQIGCRRKQSHPNPEMSESSDSSDSDDSSDSSNGHRPISKGRTDRKASSSSDDDTSDSSSSSSDSDSDSDTGSPDGAGNDSSDDDDSSYDGTEPESDDSDDSDGVGVTHTAKRRGDVTVVRRGNPAQKRRAQT